MLLLPHRDRDRPEAISALDMSNLRVEERGMPMHIAALALLDGGPLLDEAGDLRLTAVRAHVAERIHDVARLHQVLVWPGGRHHRPAWTTARDFDVADHVLTRQVPAPADEETLLGLCCDLNAPPLDRSRPLWEVWLLTGLPEGRVALLLRLHHVVADGAAALELFSSMLDPATDPPATDPPVHRNAGRQGPRRGIGRVIAATATRLSHGVALLRLGRAPALSWNQPVGSRRVHLVVRGDLARAKAVAHAHGGKVNDLVLAAVGGGAYRLLESRREIVPRLDMHVSVAASIRQPGETGGNRVGVRIVAVPIGDPDAARRLGTIAARTAPQRNRPPLQPNGRFLQRWAVHVMAHQRLINMVLSNMPGPPTRLSFAGARVREMFQLTVLQGNCAIGVAVLSYAGQLNVDIVADPDIVPDIRVFADGVAEALDQLGAAAAAADEPVAP